MMTTYDIIRCCLEGTLEGYKHPVLTFIEWRNRVRGHYNHLLEIKENWAQRPQSLPMVRVAWTDHHANLCDLLLDVEDYLNLIISRHPENHASETSEATGFCPLAEDRNGGRRTESGSTEVALASHQDGSRFRTETHE